MNFKKKWKGFREGIKSDHSIGAFLTIVFLLVVIVLNTTLYGLANKYSWYFYTDTVYEHQISNSTESYLTKAAKDGGDVKILFCQNEETLKETVTSNLVWQTCNQFANKYDFISVETVNIFTNPEIVEPYKYQRTTTGEYTIDPTTGKRIQVNNISTNSVIFTGPKNYAVLSISGFYVVTSDETVTAYNGEEIAAAMIYRCLQSDLRNAYFTVSHGESYSTAFYNRLLCAGYQLFSIDLMTDEVPSGENDLIIISNPQYDFVKGNPEKGIIAELDKVETFLENGGSVYVMLDPLVTNTVYLEQMLSEWGITIMRSKNEQGVSSVLVRDEVNATTTDGYALITSFSNSNMASTISNQMTDIGAGRIIVKQASALTLTEKTGKTVQSILESSKDSKVYADGKVLDEKGSYTVCAVSTSNLSGGTIVVLDSVYAFDQNSMTTNEYGNKDFAFLLFQEVSNANVPLGCTYLIFEVGALENLTLREARLWTILIAVLIPLGIGAVGVVTIVRRRYR